MEKKIKELPPPLSAAVSGGVGAIMFTGAVDEVEGISWAPSWWFGFMLIPTCFPSP